MNFDKIIKGVFDKSTTAIEAEFDSAMKPFIADTIATKRAEVGANVMNTCCSDDNDSE